MRRYLMLVAIGLTMLALPQRGMTLEVTDYLILEDIAAYKLEKESREFPDRKLRPITPYKTYKGSAGVVGGAGHFAYDHDDMTYETGYENSTLEMGVEVQVTQHSGSASDMWLPHEVDRNFRNYYGQPGDSYVMRQINGNTVMAAGSGGWTYHWLSANKVIRIEYTDLQMTKPEPLEVVQAYLAKHPSTLTPMTSADLRTADNKTKWIKDEMDRRLWLCDKWNAQFQLGKASQADMFRALVDNMTVFLKYRQKCYGITATDDINALFDYSRNNDAAAIMNKLTAYKTWWAANKGNAINL